MTNYYLRFPGGLAKALTFSYDDGVAQDIRLVEIFKKSQMKATFNINAGLFAPEDTAHDPGKIHRRMTASQAKALYTEDVCEVACHAYSHAMLPHYNSAFICAQLLEDRKGLEALMGKQIHGMAYPYGRFNDLTLEACKLCGIYYSRSTVSTERFELPQNWLQWPATCHHNNPRLMELADKFLAAQVIRQPQLFYVWGHSYEFDRNENWQVIEQFCEKMANKQDIWYATNMEIYTAWLDFTRLETSADGRSLYNPSCRSVWIGCGADRVLEIKPGQTVQL